MAIVDGKVTVPFAVPALASLLGVSKSGGWYRHKDICTAAAINAWSKVKPVRSSLYGPLSDADRAAVNYGFDLSTITRTSAAAALAIAKTNNGIWTYLKPRGYVSAQLTEWFRIIGDFAGYNHNAPVAYECFCPASQQVRPVTVQVYDNAFEGAEIALTDLAGLTVGTDTGRDMDDWRLGLAWRQGTSGNVNVIYHVNTLEYCFEDIDGEGGREHLSFTAPANGTYEWCFFITDYDPSDDPNSGDSYRYVYLPGGFGQVTISGGDTPIPPAQLSVTIEITAIHVTGAPYVSALECDFDVYSNDEFEVEVYAYLYDESDYPLKNAYDSVETASSEEYVYPELTGINFLGNYEKSDLFLRFKLRYRQGAGAWTEVWYNPVSGQYTANQPNAYDIDTIIDAISDE